MDHGLSKSQTWVEVTALKPKGMEYILGREKGSIKKKRTWEMTSLNVCHIPLSQSYGWVILKPTRSQAGDIEIQLPIFLLNTSIYV